MAELGEVAVDDALDVGIELPSQRAPLQSTQPGEARPEDLIGVVLEPHRGAAIDDRTLTTEKLSEANRGSLVHSLGERKRTHAQADNACDAGVRPPLHWRRGAGEQELARVRTGIYGTTNAVP